MKGPQLTGILFGLFLLSSVFLYVTGYGAHLAGMAFFNYQEPDGVFDPEQAVDAPDYNNVAFWAALPTTVDPADLVPAGIAAGSQGERPIDTFFIHPTGFLTSGSWTSPMNPDSGTEENTQWMMANQASAYNGCCNIYAPRYREANIFVYFSADIKRRDAVLDFAYQDVKRSFEYFIEHYNEGRPFIIASHSQGTHHAIRLLKEVVDRSDLHKRMVAAYIIGSTIIPFHPIGLMQWPTSHPVRAPKIFTALSIGTQCPRALAQWSGLNPVFVPIPSRGRSTKKWPQQRSMRAP